jgi:hypothetical protein
MFIFTKQHGQTGKDNPWEMVAYQAGIGAFLVLYPVETLHPKGATADNQ